MDSLTEALQLFEAGYCPIPIRPTRCTHPAVKWGKYRDEGYCPHKGVVGKWFARKRRGIALIGGRISQGLEALDFDNHTTSGSEFATWKTKIPPELFARLVIYETPRNGYRACWRCFPGMTEAKIVLAWRSRDEASIELLGTGLNLVPGGCADAHETGLPYLYIQNHLCDKPKVSGEERELMVSAARSLTLWTPPPPPPPKPYVKKSGAADWWPADDFNSRMSWEKILEPHGWQKIGDDAWLRPGKSGGISATTTTRDDVDLFKCYSSSTNFHKVGADGKPRGYEKWAVWAVLNCTNEKGETDFKEAVEKITRLGYGRVNRDPSKLHDAVMEFYNNV